MNVCLLCNEPEPCNHYQPGRDVELICSKCVQKLLGFSQENLVKGYRLAKGKGFESKMSALWLFMNDESRREIIRDERSDIKQRFARGRVVHSLKNEQKAGHTFEKKRPAFYQSERQNQALF